jgi:hypothetical protein
MLRLISFTEAYDYNPNELEIKEEIFQNYKYALAYIGIDFYREDVQEAILNCNDGFEDIIRAVIAYWYWLQSRNEKLEYPSACLIQAIQELWKPKNWQDEYLDNPQFKNPCLIFWERAGLMWGEELRNQLISDVNEDENGNEYILFTSGKKLSFSIALDWDWEKIKEYGMLEYHHQENLRIYKEKFILSSQGEDNFGEN